MATRTSNMISQREYLGSWRGRPISHNMDWKMFPEKTEQTDIIEPDDYVYQDQRTTLMDFSPEQNGLFASELPRRNTYARDQLNLRDGGARITTDPWQNENYDTQFHDKDPRGWSTEQPWDEYRRIQRTKMQHTDFKDDGDYSITSGAVHPNTFYKQIRATQDWLKARLKIFSEEFESRQAGGVGVYDNISRVYRSDQESTNVLVDGVAPSRTYDDPEIAQHHNINISNLVHLGGKYFRENTTTDHKVKVAAYNKLYKDMGIIPHESQLRIMEDDTPWLKPTQQTNKNLVKMMSSQIYSDNSNISPYTASEIGRILMQNETQDPMNPYREKMQDTRNISLTKDIVALLGITETEIKFLNSQDLTNNKQAKKALANVHELIDTVHRLSPNEKLSIKNELLIKSNGSKLVPGTGNNRHVVVNPKAVEFMNKQVKSAGAQDIEKNRNNTDASLLTKQNIKLWITKSKNRSDMNNINNHVESSAKTLDYTKSRNIYKHLGLQDINKNQNNTLNEQKYKNSKTITNNLQMLQTNIQDNLRTVEIDNEFGENKSLRRNIAPLGTKYMNKSTTTDIDVSELAEITNN